MVLLRETLESYRNILLKLVRYAANQEDVYSFGYPNKKPTTGENYKWLVINCGLAWQNIDPFD